MSILEKNDPFRKLYKGKFYEVIVYHCKKEITFRRGSIWWFFVQIVEIYS